MPVIDGESGVLSERGVLLLLFYGRVFAARVCVVVDVDGRKFL